MNSGADAGETQADIPPFRYTAALADSIENSWQARWEKDATFHAPNPTGRLAEAFDPARMDILLLMAPTASSIGYNGRGDYAMLPDGALRKRREHQVVPFVYAGAAIMSPAIFADAPKGEFSLTRMFDTANEQERLFGLRLDGVWMHVGTPDAVTAAEEAFLESVA